MTPLMFNSTQPAYSCRWFWMTKYPEMLTKKKLKAYKFHLRSIPRVCFHSV